MEHVAVVSIQTQLATEHERSYQRLRKTASRLVSWEDTEDVVQDAFLNALQSGSGFRGQAAVRTWLHRIVVNAALDRCRREKRRGTPLSLEAVPRLATHVDPFEHELLRRALRSLTPAERSIYVLHAVLGFRHDEIAERLGIACATSRGRWHKARKRLQAMLAAPAVE